ncbi:MAG: hypothetical protein NC548_05905 [Lachnospiraceae bacterium]|nr:hypothetical protein [Lachnospiraceae bacterium]
MRFDIRDVANRELEDAEKLVRGAQDSKGRVVIYTNPKDKGSVLYLSTLIRSLEEIGIRSFITLPQESFTTAIDFDKSLRQMASTSDVCAILVQRPIQPHLMSSELTTVTELARSSEYGWKFVDKKFDEVNMMDETNYPCTAIALMAIIRIVFPAPEERNQKLATIINRSQNVGRPLSQLLMNCQVTTAVCNSKTPKTILWRLLENSQIIVTATGDKDLFGAHERHYFVPNNTERRLVIDVGMPGDIDDSLDTELLEAKNVYYLPSKGGIGLLTKAILVKNIATNYAKFNI